MSCFNQDGVFKELLRVGLKSKNPPILIGKSVLDYMCYLKGINLVASDLYTRLEICLSEIADNDRKIRWFKAVIKRCNFENKVTVVSQDITSGIVQLKLEEDDTYVGTVIIRDYVSDPVTYVPFGEDYIVCERVESVLNYYMSRVELCFGGNLEDFISAYNGLQLLTCSFDTYVALLDFWEGVSYLASGRFPTRDLRELLASVGEDGDTLVPQINKALVNFVVPFGKIDRENFVDGVWRYCWHPKKMKWVQY